MSGVAEPRPYVLPAAASLREALSALLRGEVGVALLVDEDGRLRAVMSDGEIRRALAEGADLDAPALKIRGGKSEAGGRLITARLGTPGEELRALMKTESVRQVPLLDAEGRCIQLARIEELVPGTPLGVEALVMAGGFGKRLGSLTEDLPKPMLPVGGRPLMEHLVERLRESGIRRVNVATHFREEKIKGHFGDGRQFGVDIRYLSEEEPLGTAGALSLLEPGDLPVLVVNGDLFTRVDFRALLKFHEEQNAELTVGSRRYEMQVPYGVLEREGLRITRIVEKPLYGFLVNAGVYLLAPKIPARVPRNRRYDMTDLIEAVIGDGGRVIGFPILEYWLDIGRPTDYEKARADYEEGRTGA